MCSPRSDLPPELDLAVTRAAGRLGSWASQVQYYQTVDSTNTIALKAAAAGAPEGTVILAGTQTAGRGRQGRVWYSPANAGIYASVVFRPADWSSAADHGLPGRGGERLLTLMGGVAIATAVRTSIGLPVRIKWPNDIVVEDQVGARGTACRKIGGILAEAAGLGTPLKFVVLGFGMNVWPAPYPRDLTERAASLSGELGRDVDANAVLVESLAALKRGRDDLASGRLDAVLVEWRALAIGVEGCDVEWQTGTGEMRGTTAGIDDEGALLVRVGSRIERVVSGGVHWL